MSDLAEPLGKSLWRGLIGGAPFLIILIPFALLFGVSATEAGLSLAETMGFAVLVVAGAAQFTALQLLQDNAPVIVVLVTSLVVNLRMAMYSAALTVHLGPAPFLQRAFVAYMNVDQVYMLAQAEYDARPDAPVRNKVAFFAGAAALVAPPWFIFTWVGAQFGTVIPEGSGMDFALPIVFLAMIAPALRTVAHIAAACVSVILALLLVGLPSGLGLILAGLAAMRVGARVETWMERRA